MTGQRVALQPIRDAASRGAYALRPHAVSHMLAEGFGERDIVEAVLNGSLLEEYAGEQRCLLVGTFSVSQTISEHLHVVVDYWTETEVIEWIDIVTAYIPRRPFWQTPWIRGRRK